MLIRALFLAFLFLATPAAAAPLNGSDASIYTEAFKSLSGRSGMEALRIANAASDRTLYDVVSGLALGMDDNAYDFATTRNFLATHPVWPESEKKAIALQAEKKMTGVDSATVLSFFSQFPPQTGSGFFAYANALRESGQETKWREAVKKRWHASSMGEDEQRNFHSAFASMLTPEDTHARLDDLLWDGSFEQAARLYPLVSPGYKALALARIALVKNAKNAAKLVAKVPKNLQNDAGLLYERARYRRKQGDDKGAREMLVKMGARGEHPEKSWEERNIQTRNLILLKDYASAYHLVANHSLPQGQEQADAEFLAGWLALRFLDKPADALRHFTKLQANVNSPISLARAGYWQGRAQEALGHDKEAQAAYTRAAVYGTSYYGQLAATKLYASSTIAAQAPAIAAAERARFDATPLAIAIRQLVQIGEKTTATRLALAMANGATTENEYRLIAGTMLEMQQPEIAVKVSKAAARKKILLPVEGYPVLLSMGSGPSAPLAHAIMRQESEFDTTVTSRSDARGLMQLLPSTARHVVNRQNVDANPDDLYNPDNNVRMGVAYIENMLENFDGCLPMAIASYNAGPGRVREWLGKMGSPRDMDSIDWVEMIPFNETRNYVQRVLEALQIYRAKFSGGTALLNIHNDVRS
jgi:soluble lytic murein transglycosylase